MARTYADEYLPVLDAALEQEIGIFVKVADTSTRHNLENLLYQLRKECAPTYDELALFRPVIDGDDAILFIAKRTVELPE